MKRSLLFTFGVLLAVTLFFAADTALAQNLGGGLVRQAAERAGYSPSTNTTTFSQILGVVVRAVLSFAGVIFMALMVYAGYLWMTARGDEGKVDKAIDIIRTAVIGLIIVLGAYSITAFVLPRVLERTTGGSVNTGATYFCCRYNRAAGANPPVFASALNTVDECRQRCLSDSEVTDKTSCSNGSNALVTPVSSVEECR